MTQEEIQEGNKLIDSHFNDEDAEYINKVATYHNSWNDLMYVVCNLRNYGCSIKITDGIERDCECEITYESMPEEYDIIVFNNKSTTDPIIDVVFKTIVDFFHWYNQQEK